MNASAPAADETYPPAMPREGAQDGRTLDPPAMPREGAQDGRTLEDEDQAEGLGPYLRLGAAVAAVALWTAALAHFGFGARGVIAAALCAVLAVLAAFDLEQRRIPNRIVLPAIGGILLAQLAFFSGDALEWIGAGLGAGLLFWLPALVRAGSIGMGDVKLAALLGVGLGGDVIAALFLGSLAAAPVALWILVKRGRGEVIPFGPFLALGGVLALFIAG
jgi:prepilin signal peptidase PulO-like enzyme (type II secretory pathway)